MSDEIPISESEQAFFDAMKTEEDHVAEDQQHEHQQPEVEEDNSDQGTDTPDMNDEQADSNDDPQTSQDSAEDEEQVTVSSPRSSSDEAQNEPAIEARDEGAQSGEPVPETHAPSSSAGDIAEGAQPPPRATPPPTNNPTPVPTSTTGNAAKSTSAKRKKRLPQDVVGQLEDRIADDPKGDVDAWLGLIDEYKRKGKFDDARATYERFFVVFPTAAHQWMDWVNMELNNSEFNRVEQVFSKCLLIVPNVELWSSYLDYIRRRNNLTQDPHQSARRIVGQAYDFVLNNIGQDKESGRIWQDQIGFIKSSPGTVGNRGWEDQQKMDLLRKAYQKAITQPVVGVEQMWKEYDGFEHTLNKLTARKFLQERSPSFVTARSSLIALNNITRGLRRDTIPRLPPIPGYEGEDDWNYQVTLWKKWIQWEKEDPLVLADEDPEALQSRILYAYKQALITMRFCPELWYEAAEYCFDKGMGDKGVDFLRQGIQANPESCLLTFKLAERLESTLIIEEGDAAAVRNGQIVRKPYDELLEHLYAHYPKREAREAEEIERIEDEFSREEQRERSGSPESTNSNLDYDDDEDEQKSPRVLEKERRIAEVKDKYREELRHICRIISNVWVNLMRAMRRIQGHGRVNDALGGSRGIFADARKRGKITSDVYIASALIEYHCYGDPAALRIFERGIKLFPSDEEFALAYLQHLISTNDLTNARAVFETFVSKAPADKTRRIYRVFTDYETHYGELSQVQKLEKRMAELFPDDPKLQLFTARYTYQGIDPSRFTPVLSPHQQSPKHRAAPPAIPHFDPSNLPPPPPLPLPLPIPLPGGFNAPLPHPIPPPPPPRVASPKRSLPPDNDNEDFRARKLPRADSPLKGAAGRRLNQLKQQAAAKRQPQQQAPPPTQTMLPVNAQPPQMMYQQQQQYQPPPPQQTEIPPGVMYLLNILPHADKYRGTVNANFKPEAMVRLIAGVNIPEKPPGW